MPGRLIKGFFTAFSLYSAIPVPKTRWDRESIALALCFFPLVGVVIGTALLLWHFLCVSLAVVPALFGAVAVLIPLVISGGIHMDGFIDTVDALSAHTGKEKRLEILKDPHVGAFGVLGCAAYLLLQLGVWMQIYEKPALIMLGAGGLVLSRAVNAISIASFPCARSSGLVYTFSTNASKKAAIAACTGFIGALVTLCIVRSPVWGCVMTAAVLLYTLLHRRLCIRGFGGNTGDLAGFLSQNVEMICLLAAAAGGIV